VAGYGFFGGAFGKVLLAARQLRSCGQFQADFSNDRHSNQHLQSSQSAIEQVGLCGASGKRHAIC